MTDLELRQGLGRAIAQRRTQLGMSQEALAEAADLAQSIISRVETGDRKVDSLELMELARCLDTDVGTLLEEARSLAGTPATTSGVELLALRGGPSVHSVEALGWVKRVFVDLDRLDALLRNG